MKTYTKRIKVSETFPVEENQEWSILEMGRLAEKWRVTNVGKKGNYFDAEVTEYIPDENDWM